MRKTLPRHDVILYNSPPVIRGVADGPSPVPAPEEADREGYDEDSQEHTGQGHHQGQTAALTELTTAQAVATVNGY